MGYGDGKAAADPHAKPYYKKIDAAGGAYSRQSPEAKKPPHYHGIYQIIELLKKISQQKRNGKSQNKPHRVSRCHIPG